jgi:hypothetical protein
MKRQPTYYASFVHTPMPVRVRRGRWSWMVQDGMTGPTLASGTALTERAALRARIRAEVDCRPEQERLDDICARLLAEGLPVEARYDERHRVCVTAACACSDVDHRRVMLAFARVIGPVVWSPMVREVQARTSAQATRSGSAVA